MFKRCNKLTRLEEGRVLQAWAFSSLSLGTILHWNLYLCIALCFENIRTYGQLPSCFIQRRYPHIHWVLDLYRWKEGQRETWRWNIISHAETEKETRGDATVLYMLFCHFHFVISLKLTYGVNQIAMWYPAEQAWERAEKMLWQLIGWLWQFWIKP